MTDHALAVLRDIQWSYPPSDAIKDARADKGSWFGPKRCPACFAEWNLRGVHVTDCPVAYALSVRSPQSDAPDIPAVRELARNADQLVRKALKPAPWYRRPWPK